MVLGEVSDALYLIELCIPLRALHPTLVQRCVIHSPSMQLALGVRTRMWRELGSDARCCRRLREVA